MKQYIDILQADFDLGLDTLIEDYVRKYGTQKSEKILKKVTHEKITSLIEAYLARNAKIDPDLIVNRIDSIISLTFAKHSTKFILSLLVLSTWSKMSGNHEYNKQFILYNDVIKLYDAFQRPYEL